MKKNLTLEQKIINYSLTAGLILAAQGVGEASVVKTTTGHGLPATVDDPGEEYDVDFNNDGNPDVTIFNFNLNHYFVVHNDNQAGEAAFIGTDPPTNGFYADARSQNQSIPINPAPLVWGTGDYPFANGNATLAYLAAGDWHNKTNFYLGVRFQISGQNHYGYVQMTTIDAGANLTGIIISMYAYESVANTPITEQLPVELTSFAALNLNNTVKLNWATATELNNYGFEVERVLSSAKSGSWEKIGFVEGAGNSNSNKNYSYTDAKPLSEDVYYRLKQVDNDGSYTYSNEVLVSPGTPLDFALGQNYPNPFNPVTNIGFTIPESGEVSLKIYNTLGEEVADLVNSFMEAGIYNVDFKASDLPSGIYLYRLEVKGKFLTQKKMSFIK